MSRPFTAAYGGPCAADCGERIHPGDWVAYVGDELMHEDCADDGPSDAALERHLARQARLREPCARCHLIHAGEC